jgi:L-amino acid N-acyltransferase
MTRVRLILPAAAVITEAAPRSGFPTVRLAVEADLARINEIYNYFVHHSPCTYQADPETVANRRAWFGEHGPAHPVTVAESAGRILGWAALSPFHTRSAYRFSVENSVYVDQASHGLGIGSALLADLIRRGTAAGHHTIVAGIDAEQPASLALHTKFGFQQVARFVEVGYKFGRWLDVICLQLILTSPAR